AVGNCPGTFPNLATAGASNAANVSDPGSIACQQPVLVMAKTPDGGTITAGQTATFNIVLTNNGPGPANGVTLTDPLPNGAALTWATGAAGCTITGSGATQALSCPTFGTLAERPSFPTQRSAELAVGNCPGTFPNLAT